MTPKHPFQTVVELELEPNEFTPCLVLRELPLQGGNWELLVQLPDDELQYIYVRPR